MKVLYLTKYARNGASSRLRSYQYFNHLEKNDIAVTVKPFFDESYLNDLYTNKKQSKLIVLNYYLKRFITILSVYRYDTIVIEKELFPYFFSWFERLFYLLKIKYIVDFDDAIFHNYDLNNNKLIRLFLKNKIKNVMKYSCCVLAGNDYLSSEAKKAGAPKVVYFPTVININNYKVKSYDNNINIIKIGWIGSPSTFKYVKSIEAQLIALNEFNPFELHLIGATEKLNFNGTVKYPKWSEKDEVDLLLKIDIGIMPLQNTPWEQGKCAYKLIQYMGCGLPVVASSVGMNKDVIDDNCNGFLVNHDDEWIEKLNILINDAKLREEFGSAGRKKIERMFSLELNVQKLIPLLKNARRN